jgi:hypothetical protein
MTAAKLPFGIGERVTMHAVACDIVPGRFCDEVRLRGTVAGERRTIYLGPTAEAVTALHAGGALGTLDVPALVPGAPQSEITLAKRDLVLERLAVPGTRRSRLAVRLADTPLPSRPAPSEAPSTAEVPTAAADSVAAKRASCTAAFAAALEATFADLVPAFAARSVVVDGDVAFRCAVTLWKAWSDADCA